MRGWESGYMGVMGIRIYERMGVRIYERMGVGTYERMGVRIYMYVY